MRRMWLAPLIALVLAAGDPPDATPSATPDTTAPDTTTPATPEPVAPEPAKPTHLPGLRPTKLPDGTFAGPIEGNGVTPGTLELTVVNGFVTRALVRQGDGAPMTLTSSAAPNDLALRLGGRAGDDFLKLSGDFWDADFGSGRFDGTLAKKKVVGTWRLARR